MNLVPRTLRRRRLAAAVAAGVAAVAVGAPAALAQSAPAGGPRLVVREVDATDPANVKVTFIYTGDRADLDGLTLREDDKIIGTSLAKPLGDDPDESIGVVLLVDTSATMETDATLVRAKDAALGFIDGTGPNDRVAVVSFADQANVRQGLTDDRALLTKAVNDLAAAGETAIWNGITRATALFSGQSSLQPNIVILTDGAENIGGASFDSANRAVDESGAAVFVVAVNHGSLDTSPLQKLADASGGQLVETSDPGKLTALLDDVRTSLSSQYTMTYASQASDGVSNLDLTVGSSTANASFVAGSSAAGATNTKALEVADSRGPDFLHTPLGKYAGIGLAALAALLGAYAIVLIFVRDTSGLSKVLQPYSEGYVAEDEEEAEADSGMAQTAFIQRAVEFTGNLAERQGFLTRVENALERANLPLRAAEALFFYLASVVVLGALATLLLRSAFLGLFALVFFAMLPPAILNYLASRRKKQFLAMLPDTLQLLSGTLRAGYSMMQGVEAVSQEVSEPMQREFRRVVTESRLGRPLEESLDAVGDRMDSPDFKWAVMAIRIQREVGGNLSELLLTVAETMTARERLRRDVAALTAEGKISAIVLGILPVGLFGAMYVINKEYVSVLWSEGIGQAMAVGAFLLAVAGYAWMLKMIKIEI